MLPDVLIENFGYLLRGTVMTVGLAAATVVPSALIGMVLALAKVFGGIAVRIAVEVYLDVVRNADGSLKVVDGDTYQFNQERGLIVIDSPEVGLVAVLPIGMAVVSSVNLTPEVGAKLRKGDEFGFFMFGGSDIVMLFQSKRVAIDAKVGTKYLQGQRIGQVP